MESENIYQNDSPMQFGVTNVTLSEEKAHFVHLFINNLGNAAAACRAMGISRMTYDRWMKDDEYFRNEIRDAVEGFIDEAESESRKLVRNGDPKMICFILETKGKDRGYVKRSETDSKVTLKDSQQLRDEIMSDLFDE